MPCAFMGITRMGRGFLTRGALRGVPGRFPGPVNSRGTQNGGAMRYSKFGPLKKACDHLTKSDLTTLWKQILESKAISEKNRETLVSLDKNLAVLVEHLKAQNGRVEKLESYTEANFREIKKEADWARMKITLMIGGLTVLAFFVGAKLLNFL